MKTRTGFVSNSSSSSFIIGFPRQVVSADDMHSLMFPNGPRVIAHYGHHMTSENAARRVFEDIQEDKPLTPEEMVDAFREGSAVCSSPIPFPSNNYWELPDGEYEKARDKYIVDRDAAAKKLADLLIAENPGTTFYGLDYGDRWGESAMEHGDPFCNLVHIRVNNH